MAVAGTCLDEDDHLLFSRFHLSEITKLVRWSGGPQRSLSMIKQIFLSLPVADLPKSLAFFKALGFAQNTEFSDDTGACIVVSETIYVMLLTHPKFLQFTPKEVCDTSKAVEVLISLSCASREEVDDLVAKALAAGGSTYDKPEDLGFMYSHSFVDLDGHGWGVMYFPEPAPKA